MIKKPINLNLKQIDISKSSKDEKKTSNKSNSNNENKTIGNTKSNQSISKSNLSTNQKSVKSSTTNTSTTNTSTTSSTNSSTNKNKLKVPFEVKPPTSTTKTEPKYSKDNQNLRLLNQAEEKRQILNKTKLNKVTEDKAERALNRSNLKTINTSTNQIKSNKNITNSQKSSPPPNKQPKLTSDKTTNRLVDFYLKNLPDPFDYLDENRKTPEIYQNKNQSKELITNLNDKSIIKDDQLKIQLKDDQLKVKLKDKQETNKLESNKDNIINDNLVSNLSKQFLNNEKNRLENEQLIDIKIKNEYERRILKNKIDKLMKVLINYKLQTYTNDLVDELNDSLDKITTKSNDNKI